MNPVQKQLLGLGAAVMLAMLIFPPWTKITHHVVMETDRNRSVAETETQQFAGYSPLFEPPPTRGLANPQVLVPGDSYESVQIDLARFLLQWVTAAFLTAAGLLLFKDSDNALADFRRPLKRLPLSRGHGGQVCLVGRQQACILAPPTGGL